MDEHERYRKKELRDIFRNSLRNSLREIDKLEQELDNYLQSVPRSPTTSQAQDRLVKKTDYYIRLGEAYRNLLSLLGASSEETTNDNTRINLSNSNAIPISASGNNALEIAYSYFEQATDTVNQSTYPSKNKDADRKRIHDRLNTTVHQVGEAEKTLVEEKKNKLQPLISSNKPPYTGHLDKPIALRLPLAGLIIVILFGLVSVYGRIPISFALHIPPYNCVSGSITVNGSTALLPLMNIAANKYHNFCGDSTIKVNPDQAADGTTLPVGSANALNQVLNNTIDIATTDTFADTTTSNLQDNQVAAAVFALVVNSDVTSTENLDLNSYQIAAIYSGADKKWSDVDKKWISENITLVSRPPSSETRSIFENYILQSPETASGPPQLTDDSTAAVANNICNTHGAMGYVSLYYYYDYYLHHNRCLRIVSIDQHDPRSAPLVTNGTYQFWSVEHMYTNGPPKGLTQAFINFMYSDTIRSYIDQYETYGYLNITDIPSNLRSNH